MTDTLNLNQNSTPLFMLPNVEQDEDKVYAKTVADILGDKSVDQLRQEQFETAQEDLLQATYRNISHRESDAQTKAFAESYLLTNQALSWYNKYAKDSEIANKAAAEAATSKRFKNPQTYVNYLVDNEDSYKSVDAYDNAIYQTNYLIHQAVEDPEFDLNMLWRVARDTALSYVGNKFFIGKGGAVRQGVGKVLDSNGLGTALDITMMGGEKSIHQHQVTVRDMYLDAVDAFQTEEFPQKVKELTDYILAVPSEYRTDLLLAIDEGPTMYADAGGITGYYGLKATGRTFGYVFNKTRDVASFAKMSIKGGIKRGAKKVEDVADAIDERKASTALVPYKDNQLTVVADGGKYVTESRVLPPVTTLKLEDGRRITYLGAPEKRLQLSAPVDYKQIEAADRKLLTSNFEHTTKAFVDENYNPIIRTSREWLPEKRRIRYTYDNEGRGFTDKEAEALVLKMDNDFYNEQVFSKKMKLIFNAETGNLDVKGSTDLYTTVSAAAHDTFNRAEFSVRTMRSGETGLMYGPGSYSSLDETVGDAASKHHYSPSLDHRTFFENMNNKIVQHATRTGANVSETRNELNKLFAKIGLSEKEEGKDFYTKLKKIRRYNRYLKGSGEVYETVSAVLDDMLEMYKTKKTGVVNSWHMKEPDYDKKWIDQRYINISDMATLGEQSPEISKKLGKVNEKLLKRLEEIGFKAVKDNLVKDGVPSNIDKVHQAVDPMGYIEVQKRPVIWEMEVLSDLEPWYRRVALGNMTAEDLLQYGVDINGPKLFPEGTYDFKALRSAMDKTGALLLEDDLVKSGIIGGAQSSTNFVVFKDAPSVYTNVFKQEYNLKGNHHQKLLDSGALKRYDPDIGGWVVDYYLTTPGRGRKPVIIYKDPVANFKYKDKK